MIEQFTDQNFRDDSLDVIAHANDICATYAAQGFDLTLRQLYYQFVSRDLTAGWSSGANTQRSYKRLGSIVNDARLAGLMDWDYIKDRTRNVEGTFFGWDGTDQWTAAYIKGSNYREAIWEGQEYRPEVWVEKDALVDVVARACRTYRVPFFSCRGYVSQSEMYDAAKRVQQRRDEGLTPLIIHLGDHDPSGIDMTRDIADRLSLMSYEPVEVRRIALTMTQIDRYNPPPNPAKLTDARAQSYLRTYGNESWELDALEPGVMVDLIRSTILDLIEPDPWEAALAQEREGQAVIQAVADRWTEIEDYLAENPVS